jgi:hypothetical protein
VLITGVGGSSPANLTSQSSEVGKLFPCTVCLRNFNGLNALIRSLNAISSQFDGASPKFARATVSGLAIPFPKGGWSSSPNSAALRGVVPRFDPTTLHQEVGANHPGFPAPTISRQFKGLNAEANGLRPNGAKDEFLLAATAQNLRKLAKLIPLPAPIFAT